MSPPDPHLHNLFTNFLATFEKHMFERLKEEGGNVTLVDVNNKPVIEEVNKVREAVEKENSSISGLADRIEKDITPIFNLTEALKDMGEQMLAREKKIIDTGDSLVQLGNQIWKVVNRTFWATVAIWVLQATTIVILLIRLKKGG